MLKTKNLFVILIVLPFSSFSQELRLVKENPNKFFVEQYYVLSTKPGIKQGLYQKYLASTLVLVQQGYFKDNRRDSVWARYDSKGRMIELGGYSSGTKNGYWKNIIYNGDTAVAVREGNWRDGNMVDSWTFRNPDGSLNYKCDFTKKTILEYGINEEPSTFIDNKDTLSATLDTPAIHMGGADTLLRLLSSNIKIPLTYPGRGGLKEIPGNFKVLLSFTVNENGKLEDYKVIRGSKKEYNDEALRALKLCDDGNWIPAIYKGHPVKVVEIIPITFNVSIRNDGPTALSGFL
jgi:TonB family protein